VGTGLTMRDYYTDRDSSFTAGPREKPVYEMPGLPCHGAGCQGAWCHCQRCGEVAPLDDVGECQACHEEPDDLACDVCGRNPCTCNA